MSRATALSINAIRPFVTDVTNHLKLQLYVKGVRCGHCIYKIEKALDVEPGVASYQVNDGGQNLSIYVDCIERFPRVMASISDLGFEPIPIKQDDLSRNEDLEMKRSLKQLAVAGVCSGNIMLFSASIYFGAPRPFQNFFNMLSFVLTIPVIFYSAEPIWRGVLNAISTRRFNLDLPIGLAVGFGFTFSIYSLLGGLESIYFDSISVVIFIILCSRVLLNQYVKSIYRKNLIQCIPGVYQARVLRGEQEVLVSPEEVKKGDLVKVLRSEVFPVDGEIVSQSAIVDASVLSGESEPLVLKKGEKVFAGSQLCAKDCVVKTVRSTGQTRVGQLVENSLKSIEYGKEESYRYVSFFTLLVVAVSGISFFSLLFLQGSAVAFQRAFAIIIVACPCAVSFGLPLIRMLSGQLCLKNGLVVKNPYMLTKITEISNICFDKTGTLTESKVEICKEDFAKFSKEHQECIMSVELSMDHPISNGFRSLSIDDFDGLEVLDFKYMPGHGISGVVKGSHIEILSREDSVSENNKSKYLHVSVDQVYIGKIRVFSAVKKTAQGLIDFLSQKGKKIFLLSGDNKEQVENLWRLIPDYAKGEVLSQVSPEEKEKFVSDLQGSSMMIGDGINDIAALQKANVGVTMPGALENNLNIADISLLKGDLSLIEKVYFIAERVKKTELGLLGFTTVYNTICIALAILGYITPVAAAILMPVSSLLVLSIVMLSLRRV